MKIFLSHSSMDKPLLREIIQHLAPGLHSWIDERELVWGEPVELNLKQAVKNSDLFIILLSKGAVESEWVMKELKWAYDKENIEKSSFVLPILLPDVKMDDFPSDINERLFLRLQDTENISIKNLTDKINLRIFHWLVKKYDSLEVKIAKKDILESIVNPKIKKRLKKVLETASKLIYTVVGAPEIYYHDREILLSMEKGDVYKATHPFSANKTAHHMHSAQFKAYTYAQVSIANKGAKILRLYIAPNETINDLSDLEKQHLIEINSSNIEARITSTKAIPDNDLGEDFVIFNKNLLGVAIPKKGEMLGSEYRYSIDDNSEFIEKYDNYFDMLFEAATPINEISNDKYNENLKQNVQERHREKNVNEPAFILQTSASLNGSFIQRLLVVLRTSGCSYDKDNRGCYMCDFKRHAVEEKYINKNVLLNQLDYALVQAIFGKDDVTQIDLLSLGSFLHDNEVSEEFRIEAFKKLSQIDGLKKIVIESRAPYITEKRIKSLKKVLRNDQILEIGLGVETCNEDFRNNVLHKTLYDTEIRKAIEVCSLTNTNFLAYLLIGTMSLTEEEAVDDAIKSAQYIAKLCNSKNVNFRIAFEPVFITHDTKLEEDYIKGNYQLINLWRVIDVIKATHELGTIFIGLSDENLSRMRTPRGCDKCTDDLKEAIERYNGSQSLDEFINISCECQL